MAHIKTYRTKVESVLAIQLTAETADAAAVWVGGRKIEEKDPFDENKITYGLNVPTLKGVVRASEPDYILQGESGGFEIMSAEQFEAQYERPSR